MTTTLTAARPFWTADRLGRYATHAARILLGLPFLVFGVLGVLDMIPPPEGGIPPGAMAFGAALAQTGYMMPLVKGTEAVCGALLLSNRFVPLALVVLAPVVVNIFLFHLFLTPGEVGMASFIVLLEAGLAYAHRASYRLLLSPRA
jgi:uncharacterized membrane protein YphA (DoxX/SURF4 family)